MEQISVSYNHYSTSVGNNLKTIQITTKYRYHMMKQEKLKIYCEVAITEACKKHRINIIIIKVLEEHVHLIVDCPRILSDAQLMQIIKGLSSYILFRLCPNLRLRYSRGHFWNKGYFCAGCGNDFERALAYIENQELHHSS
ncbi:MAG: IS200/IS605 family transposase [Nanoarchaeota archaeon]|nr:IS200/IS605 family transposase [Nanoarchaeota archaeon]